jgi:hypothetical protein
MSSATAAMTAMNSITDYADAEARMAVGRFYAFVVAAHTDLVPLAYLSHKSVVVRVNSNPERQ